MTSFLFNKYFLGLGAVAIFAVPVIDFTSNVLDGIAQTLAVIPQ